jgi:hypothetical protein
MRRWDFPFKVGFLWMVLNGQDLEEGDLSIHYWIVVCLGRGDESGALNISIQSGDLEEVLQERVDVVKARTDCPVVVVVG